MIYYILQGIFSHSNLILLEIIWQRLSSSSCINEKYMISLTKYTLATLSCGKLRSHKLWALVAKSINSKVSIVRLPGCYESRKHVSV